MTFSKYDCEQHVNTFHASQIDDTSHPNSKKQDELTTEKSDVHSTEKFIPKISLFFQKFCTICKFYTDGDKYEEHMSNHRLICFICKTSRKTSYELDFHRYTKHSQQLLLSKYIRHHHCPHCTFEAHTSADIRVHDGITHETSVITCPVCFEVTKNVFELDRHARTKHANYYCPTCNILTHPLSEKAEEGPKSLCIHHCSYCGHFFPTGKELHSHIALKHWKESGMRPSAIKVKINDPTRKPTLKRVLLAGRNEQGKSTVTKVATQPNILNHGKRPSSSIPTVDLTMDDEVKAKAPRIQTASSNARDLTDMAYRQSLVNPNPKVTMVPANTLVFLIPSSSN